MTPGKWLSTAPFEKPTHWHQTFFPVVERFALNKGETVTGIVSCQPHRKNYRGLFIEIKINEPAQEQESPFTYDWE